MIASSHADRVLANRGAPLIFEPGGLIWQRDWSQWIAWNALTLPSGNSQLEFTPHPIALRSEQALPLARSWL